MADTAVRTDNAPGAGSATPGAGKVGLGGVDRIYRPPLLRQMAGAAAILCVVLIGLILLFATVAELSEGSPYGLIGFVVTAAIVVLSGRALPRVFNCWTRLTPDRAMSRGLFNGGEMKRADVGQFATGLRRRWSVVTLLPRDRSLRPIVLRPYGGADAAFISWFDGIPEYSRARRGGGLGRNQPTPDIESPSIRPVDWTQEVVSIVGGVLFFWAFIIPAPSGLCFAILAASPAVAAAVVVSDKSRRWAFLARPFSGGSSTAFGWGPAAVGLVCWSNTLLNIAQPGSVTEAAFLVSLVFVAAGWLLDRTEDQARMWLPQSRAIALCVLGLFYGYGVVSGTDVLLDRAAGATSAVKVNRKWSCCARGAQTYNFSVAPLGASSNVPFYIVHGPRSLWESTAVGSRLCVTRHSGALSIPWREIHSCGAA